MASRNSSTTFSSRSSQKWTNIAEILNLPLGRQLEASQKSPTERTRALHLHRACCARKHRQGGATAPPESISTKTPARQRTEVTCFHTSLMDAPYRWAPNSRSKGGQTCRAPPGTLRLWPGAPQTPEETPLIPRSKATEGYLDKHSLISYSVFPSHISRLQTFKPGHRDM